MVAVAPAMADPEVLSRETDSAHMVPNGLGPWMRVSEEKEPGKGARLIPWVEKGSDTNQTAGGDHSFGSHLTSTTVLIRHHTRSRTSDWNGCFDRLRGVERKG